MTYFMFTLMDPRFITQLKRLGCGVKIRHTCISWLVYCVVFSRSLSTTQLKIQHYLISYTSCFSSRIDGSYNVKFLII